jgi:hypothetical protein
MMLQLRSDDFRGGFRRFATQAEFTDGTVGAEASGEVNRGSVACGDSGQNGKTGQSEQPGGVVEAEAASELTSGGAEDSSPQRSVEGAEALNLDGDGVCTR